jgi:hypothetical protein
VLLQVLVLPLYGWLRFPWLSLEWIANTFLGPQSAAVGVFGPAKQTEEEETLFCYPHMAFHPTESHRIKLLNLTHHKFVQLE